MKYEKPEMQIVTAAGSAICNPMQKGTGGPQDSTQPVQYVSVSAYEVDE